MSKVQVAIDGFKNLPKPHVESVLPLVYQYTIVNICTTKNTFLKDTRPKTESNRRGISLRRFYGHRSLTLSLRFRRLFQNTSFFNGEPNNLELVRPLEVHSHNRVGHPLFNPINMCLRTGSPRLQIRTLPSLIKSYKSFDCLKVFGLFSVVTFLKIYVHDSQPKRS